MKHKILFLLLILVLFVATACAAPTLEPAALVLADPLPARPGELMIVQPDGSNGELVTYNVTTGQEQFRLPAGFLTTDKSLYYSAVQQGGHTRLNLYELQTGSITNYFNVDGDWSLDGMSADGRWLVLSGVPDEAELQRRQSVGAWQTEIQVFDTVDGRSSHTLILDGNYEVDAIAGDGTGLFLIQHLPAANPDHYLIWGYDLSVNEMLDAPLRDKRFFDEVMVGYPWGSISDPDGVWYLTLYLNTQRNVAFVHALNMENRWTYCIDLPSDGGDMNMLQQYTLALAPNGQKIYAANAALGVVAEIDLLDITATKQNRFPGQRLSSRFQNNEGLNASLITANGQTLYFTNGQQLWAYDTGVGEVSEPLLKDQIDSVDGLAISDDDQTLYVVQVERPLLTIPITAGDSGE